MQDYIDAALREGIDIFGFSCHAPMDFDYKYRMKISDLNPYLKSIKDLKNSNSQIEILLALEVDYILNREDLIEREVLEAQTDYLIGSVHFLGDWGFDNPEFVGQWQERGVLETWSEYLDSIEAMAKSRLFQICGHIDLPKLFGARMPSSLMPKMRHTLEVLRDNDMVIEVNAAGLRKDIKEHYPSFDLLKLAREIGLDITLSSDAHSPSQVGFGYEVCKKAALDAGFRKVAIFRNKEKIMLDL